MQKNSLTIFKINQKIRIGFQIDLNILAEKLKNQTTIYVGFKRVVFVNNINNFKLLLFIVISKPSRNRSSLKISVSKNSKLANGNFFIRLPSKLIYMVLLVRIPKLRLYFNIL